MRGGLKPKNYGRRATCIESQRQVVLDRGNSTPLVLTINLLAKAPKPLL